MVAESKIITGVKNMQSDLSCMRFKGLRYSNKRRIINCADKTRVSENLPDLIAAKHMYEAAGSKIRVLATVR